jgi:hypothetical protein
MSMPIKPQPSHKPVVRQPTSVAPTAFPAFVIPVSPAPIAKQSKAPPVTYPSYLPSDIKESAPLKGVFEQAVRTVKKLEKEYSQTLPFDVFFHRSGHETYWRCPRAYYLNYHYLGTGIYKAPMQLHLEVGSAVHLGFAAILKGHDVEYAVNTAQQYLRHGEKFVLLNPTYEQQEQLALIAGLLYSFWFYMWPSFQKQFKVLYVERGVVSSEVYTPATNETVRIHRMSRPDAILQDRKTNEIVGWSLKTINDLNEWKRMQFHNDLQGLTEMYNAEVMFEQIRAAGPDAFVQDWLNGLAGKPTYAQIKERLAEWETLPTNVDYIQTLFLVKGVRKPFGEQDEVDVFDLPSGEEKEFRQHSPLCYYWHNNGTAPAGSPARSWSARFYKTDNKSYNRLGKGFERIAVWEKWRESGSFDTTNSTKEINARVSDWVQQLNSGGVYPSTLPDDRNIKNPLSQIVVYDEPMYRNRQHMQSVVERQVAKVQHRIAFDLFDIHKLINEGHVESAQELVDQYFDQHLTSCRQPYRCEFARLCHETPEGWMDHKALPEGYSIRKPHHDFESEMRGSAT